MADLDLTGTSDIATFVDSDLLLYLHLSADSISSSTLLLNLLDVENNYLQLNSDTQSVFNITGDLILEIKCLNCRFNISGHSRDLHCHRTARFNNDEIKLNCNMYKIIQTKK